MGSTCETNRGRKSRDTLPLKAISLGYAIPFPWSHAFGKLALWWYSYQNH